MRLHLDNTPRPTLRDSVVGRLREAITDGTLAPGSHLGEVELSTSLGVSRATLREALRDLQRESLVSVDGRGRTSVRVVSADEIRDLFDVRLLLETAAARRLCQQDDRAVVVQELRRRLAVLEEPQDLAAGLRADLDFHGAMCTLAGNPALVRSWSALSGPILITMVAAGSEPARANAAIERHAPIVDLIEAGDANAVERYLAEHMQSAADLLLERM